MTPSRDNPVEALDEDDLFECYPDSIVESLLERDAWRASQRDSSPAFEFVVSDIDRWVPGSTVTIAFLGGDTELHEKIVDAVQQISDACGLTLDFGLDTATGDYRRWSEDDDVYQADIRISFDRPGYWSLVGTASVDRSIGRALDGVGGRPGQRSMNLSRFDVQLPQKWEGTVRHEFLHALAFQHEHQNMRGPCQHDFRWEDDSGYVPTTDSNGRFVTDPNGRRPGIYTYLSGPPNEWNRSKVDHNLRSTGAEDAIASSFDSDSVMLYRFPQLFYETNPSECAPTGDGINLSDGDKRGLRLLYLDGSAGVDHEAQIDAALGALVDARPIDGASASGAQFEHGDEPDFAGATATVLQRLKADLGQ